MAAHAGQRARAGVTTPTAEARAQKTLYRALYSAVGTQGSLLESPGEHSFALDEAYGAGQVVLDHRVSVPLPGGATWHMHPLAAVMDDGRWLGVDIVATTDPVRLRALAYDAVHLRSREGPTLMLVLLRPERGGMMREEADAVAYAYDHVFGVDEERAGEQRAFAAFRSELRDRLLEL